MDINSIQGMNAYTANVLMADPVFAQNNIKETSGAEANKESIQPVKEAFHVEITQEALALQPANIADNKNNDGMQLIIDHPPMSYALRPPNIINDTA